MPRKETKSTRRKPETGKKVSSVWSVYLLWNPRTYRTYIGASTDPHRRLRQHRREIKGGAKATFKEAGSWLPVLYLYGFKDRQEAYRWEKLLKLRASGLQDRREAFCEVAIGICPKHPKKAYSKEYPVPSGIVLKFYDKDADKQV